MQQDDMFGTPSPPSAPAGYETGPQDIFFTPFADSPHFALGFQATDAPVLSHRETGEDRIQALEDAVREQKAQVAHYRALASEAVGMNAELFDHTAGLNKRIIGLEEVVKTLSERIDGINMNKGKGGKALSINIPKTRGDDVALMVPKTEQSIIGSINSAEPSATFSMAAPTPATPATPVNPYAIFAGFPATPTTPQTPVTPSGRRRSQTLMNKSPAHDLNHKLPPCMVQIPLVPLTDKELIVFFYNSSTRPIVAMRLYARQWGPSEITNVINDHRIVLPAGYHRNTCCVKMRTALKRGREAAQEGADEYEKKARVFFETADDTSATDAIRIVGEEASSARDYEVLEMLTDLKKYPKNNDGTEALFTKCVRYCYDEKLDIKLSQIHTVAMALEGGYHPVLHPAEIDDQNVKDVVYSQVPVSSGLASPSDGSGRRVRASSSDSVDITTDEDDMANRLRGFLNRGLDNVE